MGRSPGVYEYALWREELQQTDIHLGIACECRAHTTEPLADALTVDRGERCCASRLKLNDDGLRRSWSLAELFSDSHRQFGAIPPELADRLRSLNRRKLHGGFQKLREIDLLLRVAHDDRHAVPFSLGAAWLAHEGASLDEPQSAEKPLAHPAPTMTDAAKGGNRNCHRRRASRGSAGEGKAELAPQGKSKGYGMALEEPRRTTSESLASGRWNGGEPRPLSFSDAWARQVLQLLRLMRLLLLIAMAAILMITNAYIFAEWKASRHG